MVKVTVKEEDSRVLIIMGTDSGQFLGTSQLKVKQEGELCTLEEFHVEPGAPFNDSIYRQIGWSTPPEILLFRATKNYATGHGRCDCFAARITSQSVAHLFDDNGGTFYTEDLKAQIGGGTATLVAGQTPVVGAIGHCPISTLQKMNPKSLPAGTVPPALPTRSKP